jgi:hypothetical protein
MLHDTWSGWDLFIFRVLDLSWYNVSYYDNIFCNY